MVMATRLERDSCWASAVVAFKIKNAANRQMRPGLSDAQCPLTLPSPPVRERASSLKVPASVFMPVTICVSFSANNEARECKGFVWANGQKCKEGVKASRENIQHSIFDTTSK